jgi:hypothetical protein
VYEGIPHIESAGFPEWAVWMLWSGLVLLAVVRQVFNERWKMMNWVVTDYRLVSQRYRQGNMVFDMGWVLVFVAALIFAVLGLGQSLARLAEAVFDIPTALRLALAWGLLWAIRALFLRAVNEVSEGALPAREYSASHFLTGQIFALLSAPVGILGWYVGGEHPDMGRWLAWMCIGIWLAGWLLRTGRIAWLVPEAKNRPFLMIAYLCGLELLPVLVLIKAWNW